MPLFCQAVFMDKFQTQESQLNRWPSSSCKVRFNPLRRRLRQWQQARTWARLIREAESLWYVDVRVLKRIGELELSQLLKEVPSCKRGRVNRWLVGYSVATRFQEHEMRTNE